MIEKIVNKLMKRIEDKNPQMDKKKRDTIWFGLMILFDEVPKFIAMCFITYFLGVLKSTLISFIGIAVYKTFSGGLHLKSQIGCFTMSMIIFVGNPVISKYIVWNNEVIHYLVILAILIYNILMISLYAPADTEAVPIISKKQRRNQKIMSYISMGVIFTIGVLVKDTAISNTLIFGTLIQSFNISRLAYKIFNNKYGHEVLNQGITAT